MPLHGKIVVIKRSGRDGTEFPLTTTCLFGRESDCDIRIQVPHVSKQHCRIDLNENKEVILTNLSTANPICVNGNILNQSDRLKHGDVITIVDRCFRFEYPPVPTPKKRSSRGGNTETLKVLQDQQVGDSGIVEAGDRKSADPHLKDGTNIGNIQRSLEMESKEEVSPVEGKTSSPFNDLYQMIKKSLDVKTPRKSSVSVPPTPTSSFSFTKPTSVRKSAITGEGVTPRKDGGKVFASQSVNSTPQSVKKQRRSSISSTEVVPPGVSEDSQGAKADATPPRKRISSTPKRFSVGEVIEQITATPKSPERRKSEEKTVSTKEVEEASRKKGGSTKRKSGELGTDLPNSKNKRKRVSFGGYLTPEFFDKRLPPDSPLRKGAAPRRSLSVLKPKLSLLRRASVIGLMKGLDGSPKKASPATAKASPKSRASPKTSPKSKAATPAKASPKSKAATPAKASPKSKAATPAKASPKTKAATPAKTSPKTKAASPAKASPKSKAATPAKASPKSKAASPAKASPKSKAAIPAKASPKTKAAIPAKASPKTKAATPAKTSPKTKAATPAKTSPKTKAATPAKTSPKTKAATPAKTSPKTKAATPAKTSPKTKAATPAKTSPKTKAATPAKTSPKTKAATPAKTSPKTKAATPAKALGSGAKPETPLSVTAKTPTMRGRFSVSLIGTPSPVTEMDAVVAPVFSTTTTTPKIPLRRKSIKSTSKRTPHLSKSAIKVIQRSGVSRASMKISNCWADIVKYGKPKAKTEVLATKTNLPLKKKQKAAVKPKMKTPARKLKGHVSTGHADSPITIVVGRAHRGAVALSAGAVPKVVTNIALLQKNMKMDEDLTGLTEMFKTPVTARKRKSMNIDQSKATETPAGQPTAIADPSVLNTPEEPGEMIVSPLSVASTAKGSRYNSEAVQRLFAADEESCLSSGFPSLNVTSDPSELIPAGLESKAVTPKHKPEMPECLTGVKRMMKTPRQKVEPVTDLRGKLLKTPKQKPEKPECLTGVKRLMKTPRQKSEPIEDLRGKLLKTPKQKVEQQDCLTGVKRIMKTPQSERVSKIKSLPMTPTVAVDLSLNLAEEPQELSVEIKPVQEQKTPNQRSSPRTGGKRMTQTPRVKAAPVEDIMKTPQQKPEQPACVSEIKSLPKTPTVAVDLSLNIAEEPRELSAEIKPVQEQKTPNQKSTPRTGGKKMTQTPKVKVAPVEDIMTTPQQKPEQPECLTGVKTPKQKVEQQDCLSGVKRIMKTPQSERVSEIKSLSMNPTVAVDLSMNLAEESQEQSAEMKPVQEHNTPNQRSSPRKCLTGGKRMTQTPKVKVAPVEDIMKTPQQKPEQPECLTGVKTPKQKVEQQDCLTDVKRIMKTPQSERVSEIKSLSMTPSVAVDLSLNITEEPQEQSADMQQVEEQKTPMQRSSPRECLTGGKRMTQTPRVKAAPVEDIMKTPQQKPEQPECVSEIKSLPVTPSVAGDVSLNGAEEPQEQKSSPQECLKEMLDEPVEHLDTATDESLAPVDDENVAQELQFAAEEHQPDDVSNDADGEVVVEDQNENESDSVETVPPCASEENPCVDESTENVQPEEEPVVSEVAKIVEAAVESVQEKKSVRGRRAKDVESKEETPEIAVPVRARRGRKNEAPAPTAATRGTRGRKAQVVDEVEVLVEESAPAPPAPSSNVPPKLKRGRKAKVVSEDQIEVVKIMIAEPEETPEPEQSEQNPTVEDELKTDSAAPVENSLKPKRGRKNIQPDQEEPQVVTIKDDEDQHENESDSVETVPPCAAEESPCVDESTENVQPEEEPVVSAVAKIVEAAVESVQEKKSVRGRRAKDVESKEETPEIAVPVRARRGRKNEAPAPTAATRGTRGRKAQVVDEVEVLVEESAPAPPAAASNVPPKLKRGRKVKEIIAEPEETPEPEQSEQNPTVEDELKTDSAAPVENSLKPKRGRKNIQPEISVTDQDEPQVVTIKDSTEDLVEQNKVNETEPDAEKPDANKKPVRGRRAKEVVDTQEAAEPPIDSAPVKGRRGKKPEAAAAAAVKSNTRGRNAKCDESPAESQVGAGTSSDSQENEPKLEEEAVVKTQRGRKAKQATVQTEEVKEEPAVEKPRRGRRAKNDPEAEDAVVASVSRKRGKNAKLEEEENTALVENSEDSVSQEPAKKTRKTRDVHHEQERLETPPAEEETTVPAVTKSRRGGRKTIPEPESLTVIESNVQEVAAVAEKPKTSRKPKKTSKEVVDEPELEVEEQKDEEPPVLEIIQQKKTRGTKTSKKNESAQATPVKRVREAVPVPPEVSSEQQQQPKRGRKAAAKPCTDDAVVSTEDSKSNDKVKQSTRSVRWQPDVQVFEIPQVTPVKTTRGRKAKVVVKSKETNSAEEEKLSEKPTEAQPAKRARRGAKEEPTSKQQQEEEIQPTTRRVRTAKK